MKSSIVFKGAILAAIVLNACVAGADKATDISLLAELQKYEGAKDCKSMQETHRLYTALSKNTNYDVLVDEDGATAQANKLVAEIPNLPHQLLKLRDMYQAIQSPAESYQKETQGIKVALLFFEGAQKIIDAAKVLISQPIDANTENIFSDATKTNSQISHHEGPLSYYLLPGVYCDVYENGKDKVPWEKIETCLKTTLTKIAAATPAEVLKMTYAGREAQMQRIRIKQFGYTQERIATEQALSFFNTRSQYREAFIKLCLTGQPCGELSQKFVNKFIEVAKLVDSLNLSYEERERRASYRYTIERIENAMQAADQVLRDNNLGSCRVPREK